ncbi:MAG: permease prefix domain 2-containing transporter, partial [Cytophagales bacterium]|nr:permease prefix domain 2-containing transporter [Cytophagales bacterium]
MNKKHRPPKLAHRFFRWYCHPDYREDLEGDVLERFEQRISEKGIKTARWGFLGDVLRLFRPALIKPLFKSQKLNPLIMYKYHFKFAWRSLTRNLQFSVINIVGLALGLSCCILIYSFVKYHASFDDFHTDTERIYRF